jgi:hypothetical protein
MLEFDYEKMLTEFGDTLEKLSEDTSKKTQEESVYLTASKERVVDFDRFTHSIIEELNPHNRPKSCDALLKLNRNEYYFIEFKNGRIKEIEAYEIREKFLVSMMLFLEQINQTICYSRANCYFILVCNTNIANRGKKQEGKENIRNSLIKLINLRKYEDIFIKRAFVYTVGEFDEKFIRKYGFR